MGNRITTVAGLTAVAFALAAIAFRSSVSTDHQRGSSVIGGDWMPYTVDAHSKMADYFSSNDYQSVYVTDSGGSNTTFYRVEGNGDVLLLDVPLDDLNTATPILTIPLDTEVLE